MKIVLLGVLLALLVSGCNKAEVQCTAASAQEPVIGIVKEQLEKAVARKLRGNDDGHVISLSKIRAAIGQLVIALDDIRTSKEDPNSTKRFCVGSLKVRFPSELIEDADRARESVQLGTVSDLADEADVERSADRFSTNIEFNVQPTDDGSKVFAETETGNNMFGFAAELLSSGLLRGVIEDGQRQQRLAETQQQAEQNAALQQQRDANVNAAKTENQLATQTIGAVWKSLDVGSRSRLLPLQRAWIRKKEADCRVESASASTEVSEIEVARLGCDTRVTNERVNWLQQYRSSAATEPSEEQEAEPEAM